MTPLSVSELAAVVEGQLISGDPHATVTGTAIDSRRVAPGDVFVAFRGEQADGHAFVRQAAQAGAAAVLVERPLAADELPQDGAPAVIMVHSSLSAVQRLAARERSLFTGPVIGVTGSNGKTTTKEMLAAVLSVSAPCLATAGNYNNELGLPLTLLSRRPEHQTIVLEMGMRGLGQIAHLCRIARPTSGVITNIGQSHLERLGSQENIAKAKAELLEALPADGCGFLLKTDAWLRRVADRCPGQVYWYGLDPSADAWAERLTLTAHGVRFTAHVLGQTAEVELPTYGEHNVNNALGALLVGAVHGLALTDMAQGLARLAPSSGRLRILPAGNGRTVIDDCYNASPLSTRASLRVLTDIARGGPTAAILGDMYELGAYAEAGHRAVGQEAARLGIDVLVTIGPMSQWTAEAAQAAGCPRVHPFADRDSAIARLQELLPAGCTVLVKASRGMQLEQVVQVLVSE
ncbi:UDP-N-acetylmuramoyl-tripeptide--D-alanyl-D-alanine ligase [Alicyclobacillus kakegawensis]|uniref:UDP-N-acetylmuramoyl-tripeptide--D-alanyl-D- alanine ligase n=1 Tax=Alicyclobacillus kakegawensis TaxID=392012 RepID=UPI0008360852|nr:UDP-N-acetylmuramoyl-tripeptide--D-alanyl-D-alanine ligase [Alicyclobacillus kakegawensis]